MARQCFLSAAKPCQQRDHQPRKSFVKRLQRQRLLRSHQHLFRLAGFVQPVGMIAIHQRRLAAYAAAFGGQPVVKFRLAGAKIRKQVTGIVAIGRQGQSIDRKNIPRHPQIGLADDNIRAKFLAQGKNALAQTAPRLIFKSVAPQQRCQLFTRMRLAGQRQLNQQRLRFFIAQIELCAVAENGKTANEVYLKGQSRAVFQNLMSFDAHSTRFNATWPRELSRR